MAILAAAALYLRTAAGRRMVATRVNAALEPLFAGRLTINQVGSIGVGSAAGVGATVADPEGRTVIAVEGASARISLVALLGSRSSATVRS